MSDTLTGADQCRERGDEKCTCRLMGFVDYVDEETGQKTGGQMFECVTCGRRFSNGKEISGPRIVMAVGRDTE